MAASLYNRREFHVIATTTPKVLEGGNRTHVIVFSTDANVYVGGGPGSTTGTWMYLPANQGFVDDVSRDPWYVRTLTGSGTVTGWYI